MPDRHDSESASNCRQLQYTVKPNMLHCLQAGDEGADFMQFCSASRDPYDVYTDPRVRREPATYADA